jgi:hypothetical protein
MSRAGMKDTADAHARDCSNIKRIIKPVQRISRSLGGIGNTARHRRRADVPQPCSSASSSWRTATATCITCTGMYAVGLNQWAVQRLKGVWEKLLTKWEKRYAEFDQLCNPKSNSAAMRAAAALRARVGVAGV